MKYTVRFCHLASLKLSVGDLINKGDIVGVMGNTGVGTGAHLHLDVVEGIQPGRYNLQNIADSMPKSSPRQAVLFVDNDLFGIEPVVTTGYADPEYYWKRGKLHLAFDLVPTDRHESQEHFTIHWNRTAQGLVIKAVLMDPGYGNYISVSYES